MPCVAGVMQCVITGGSVLAQLGARTPPLTPPCHRGACKGLVEQPGAWAAPLTPLCRRDDAVCDRRRRQGVRRLPEHDGGESKPRGGARVPARMHVRGLQRVCSKPRPRPRRTRRSWSGTRSSCWSASTTSTNASAGSPTSTCLGWWTSELRSLLRRAPPPSRGPPGPGCPPGPQEDQAHPEPPAPHAVPAVPGAPWE